MNADHGAQQTANRLQTVAKIIRAGIEDEGLNIRDAAEAWKISRSTLTRMVGGEQVSAKFYGLVGVELHLPRRLFRMVLDGDVQGIEEVPDLDPYIRRLILTNLASPTRDSDAATGT